MPTHDQLLERVWSPGRKGESWLIRNVVKKQRRELGSAADNPACVFTEARFCYRMGRAGGI